MKKAICNYHFGELRVVYEMISRYPRRRKLGQNYPLPPEKLEKILIDLLQIVPRKKNFNKILKKLYGHVSGKVRDQKYELARLSVLYKSKNTPAAWGVTKLGLGNEKCTFGTSEIKRERLFHRQESLSQKQLFGESL